MKSNYLIAIRFIVMTGHLVLLILLLWDREDSVKACIDWNHTYNEYNSKNIELIVGFSLSLLLLIIEFIGFLSGISMFYRIQCLFSVITHCLATICLSYFITDVWDCHLFWWIFSLFSVCPALTEIFILIIVFVFKKL